jgi:hypothetical protein
MSHSETLSRLTVGDEVPHDQLGMRKSIDKFEREWNYDAGYLRDITNASPRAAWLFYRVSSVG